MKIAVTVKPGAREDSIKKEVDGYRVLTKARAEDGKANEALRHIIAEHFDVSPSRVQVVRGTASHKKIVEIS
ncbi:MAG: DUF167 domain-containing protein [Patescibacteria group bacterium]